MLEIKRVMLSCLLPSMFEHIHDCKRVIETWTSVDEWGRGFGYLCTWLPVDTEAPVALLWRGVAGRLREGGGGGCGDPGPHGAVNPPPLSLWQEGSSLSGRTTGTRGGNSWLVTTDELCNRAAQACWRLDGHFYIVTKKSEEVTPRATKRWDLGHFSLNWIVFSISPPPHWSFLDSQGIYLLQRITKFQVGFFFPTEN